MSLAARHAVKGLHVGATPIQVIRHVRKKMREEVTRDRKLRPTRHELYRAALEAHLANQSLYIAVMA